MLIALVISYLNVLLNDFVKFRKTYYLLLFLLKVKIFEFKQFYKTNFYRLSFSYFCFIVIFVKLLMINNLFIPFLKKIGFGIYFFVEYLYSQNAFLKYFVS